jgi:hypothetical protein
MLFGSFVLSMREDGYTWDFCSMFNIGALVEEAEEWQEGGLVSGVKCVGSS